MSTFDAAQLQFAQFLTSFMPWGARLTQCDENFEPHAQAGTPAMLVSSVSVLDVGLAQDGAYYRARFGPLDAEGEGRDGAADAWTLNVVDPVVHLDAGRYAVQIVDPEGHSYAPERWLLINPNVGTEDLATIVKGH